MSSDCLFCKIVAGTIPVKTLFEDEWCVAFPDLHPQAPVHVLVVPKEHLVSLAEAGAEHTALLGRLMSAAAEVARMQGLEQGYRVVVNTGSDGGQTVRHLHLHVLGGRHMGWPPG
jgi:histidine triad (HIT) family protein